MRYVERYIKLYRAEIMEIEVLGYSVELTVCSSLTVLRILTVCCMYTLVQSRGTSTSFSASHNLQRGERSIGRIIGRGQQCAVAVA